MTGAKRSTSDKGSDFLASHVLYFLPGDRIKKIAITEMRHAEAISERIIILGGDLNGSPISAPMEETIEKMLESDTEQELAAIDLYKKSSPWQKKKMILRLKVCSLELLVRKGAI